MPISSHAGKHLQAIQYCWKGKNGLSSFLCVPPRLLNTGSQPPRAAVLRLVACVMFVGLYDRSLSACDFSSSSSSLPFQQQRRVCVSAEDTWAGGDNLAWEGDE